MAWDSERGAIRFFFGYLDGMERPLCKPRSLMFFRDFLDFCRKYFDILEDRGIIKTFFNDYSFIIHMLRAVEDVRTYYLNFT